MAAAFAAVLPRAWRPLPRTSRIIDLEEGIVDQEVDGEHSGEEHEREGLEAKAHDDADGAGDRPGKRVEESVHADEVDKDLKSPDVADGGEDKGDKEDGVQDHGGAEQERLVDVEERGDHGGASNRLHLFGLGEEGEHEADDQGSAGAAKADDEVLEERESTWVACSPAW